MNAFRTLLVAVMLVATALIAVLGSHTTSVFAAGKENVTSIDVPATETVLVSDRTGPVNQEVTQADYDKLYDQYKVTPNGTPTITSKTLDTENVETDTGHSKKSYTKETTTWVISDTAPQPAKTATDPASQETPARDNVDLAPLLLVPVTTAIVAPLAAVPAAVATAIPAAIVGGIANAVPAAVVGGALAAVPAALVGGALNALPAAVAGSALTALPAAIAGSALTALPAAIAGSALTVLPSALTGAALATAPALLKGYNDGFKDGFKLGDLLGTLKTVLPAALLGATLNAVPAALVGAALAAPVAAVNAAIPAFIAGTLLGNLVAFPAGVIAGAVPVAVISALVGLDVLNHVLPLIPLAFAAGVALPLLTAAAVLPFAVAAKLATDLLLALPVVGTIALLAGLNGLKDFVVIPALLVLDALKDAALANLLFDALKAKTAFDLFVRNPLILKALAKHAKKLAVKAFKDGFKLAALLNKAAFDLLVIKPLLDKTAFDLLVRDPLIVKALKAHAKKLAVKAFKDGFKLATLLNKLALADAAVKTLLGLNALNDFVIKPLLQRILLGNLGALHALNNPLSFGGPLFRLAKGFALPLTEITKDHLQDLAKVTLDNLARVASRALRTLGALNALNNPLSFGGPLFRLAKGFAFPIPETLKNFAENALQLALRNLGALNALNNSLSFGDPLARFLKGFAFPLTETAKNLLEDLAQLALRNLGALNALNNPFSFGGPLFRLLKGALFPVAETLKNLAEDLTQPLLRTLGALNALSNPLSRGNSLERLVKGFLFPVTETIKNLLRLPLELLINFVPITEGIAHALFNALNNPLSLLVPTVALNNFIKGYLFPLAAFYDDLFVWAYWHAVLPYAILSPIFFGSIMGLPFILVSLPGILGKMIYITEISLYYWILCVPMDQLVFAEEVPISSLRELIRGAVRILLDIYW